MPVETPGEQHLPDPRRRRGDPLRRGLRPPRLQRGARAPDGRGARALRGGRHARLRPARGDQSRPHRPLRVVGRFTGESDVAVYVHELDARVLVNFEERIVLASKDLRVFMERAGVKPELRTEIEEAYRWSKNFFKSVEIDHLVQDRDRIINGYRVHHTLGHCPGQICLEVHDLSSPRTTCCRGSRRISRRPRSAPFCGLELYLQSRRRCRARGHPRLAPRPRSAHRGPRRPDRGHRGPPAAAQPGARHLP